MWRVKWLKAHNLILMFFLPIKWGLKNKMRSKSPEVDIDDHTSTLIRALNNTYFCTKLTDNHQPIFKSNGTMSVFWRNHVMSHVGCITCFLCQSMCSRPSAHQCCPACEAELKNQCATDPHFTDSVSNIYDALFLPSGGPGALPYHAVVDSSAYSFESGPSHILDAHVRHFYPKPAEEQCAPRWQTMFDLPTHLQWLKCNSHKQAPPPQLVPMHVEIADRTRT